ncbi:hypothetical protein [Lactococcus ileimucosae]|uniref:hypothetical protein n=1 Tax=Lactococcus ileimucosae TaxID=2941329 RepID=UPI00192465FE|nr:hypothetical protein [Lactococcus ileimucosae]MBL3717285.1 hypothetical protein [Lactococcus garvieae]
MISFSGVITAIKVGWEMPSKNKINRRIILALLLQVLAMVLYFFINYGYSLISNGNFITASMIDAFSHVFYYQFRASPVFNTVVETLFPIVMVGIFLVLISRGITSGDTSKYGFVIDKEKQRVVMNTEEKETKVWLPLSLFQSLFIFGFLMLTSIQLCLFDKVVYPAMLPKLVGVVTIITVLSTLLYSIIIFIQFKDVAELAALQNLMEDSDYLEVRKVMEATIKNNGLQLEGSEFFLELNEYIELGVIKFLPEVKAEKIELDKMYKLEIPRHIRRKYEREILSRN